MKKAFLSILLLCLGIAPVYACTLPAPNPNNTIPLSIDAYIDATPIIFVGRVNSEPVNIEYFSQQLEIVVERYLKGTGAATVLINGFESTPCAPEVQPIGAEAIFWVRGHPNGDLIVEYVTGIADEAAISAITGQSLVPESLPSPIPEAAVLEAPARAESSTDMSVIYMGIGLAILLSPVLLFYFWKRS